MPTETGPVERQLEAFNKHDLNGFLSCYASDAVIRHGDGRELLNGHDAMRAFHGPSFQDPALHAEVVNRLRSGPWVVDQEHTVWTGGAVDGLIGYEVRGDLIHTVVMLGGPF